MSMSSSSATSSSSPVVDPCPSSTRPVLIVAVLSAWMARKESTCSRSDGPLEAYGSSAPCADPTRLNPTTSAPPPLRNDLRESSISGSVVHEEVALLAGRREEEPLAGLEADPHRVLPDEARGRDLRRRGRAKALEIEGSLARLVEHGHLVAAGLQRADRLAQVPEAGLAGRREVPAQRAPEGDVLRPDDVRRGRRLRRARRTRARRRCRRRVRRARGGAEGEDRVRLLDVAPGVRGARREAHAMRRRRRLTEEEVFLERHSRPAEVEVRALDADAVLEVQRVRTRRDRSAPTG